MKAIMIFVFFPFWIIKLLIACIFSIVIFIFLAIAMVFGADGKGATEINNSLWRWACDYPPLKM